MKKNQLIGFLYSSVLLLSMGCTEVDVNYPSGGAPGPDPDPDTSSLVQITPKGGFSAKGVYYFYDSQTGEQVAATNTKSDGSFEGELPFGTYRMLAVSDGEDNTHFAGMDTYAGAMACLKSSGVSDVYEQLADVQYMALDEVNVEEDKTAEYAAEPQSLVHTLTLTLDLSAVSGTIEGLSGTMNGFWPAVLLSSGEPVDAAAAATSFLSFEETFGATRAQDATATRAQDATATRAGKTTLTLRSLGLQSPADKDGKPVYESKMELRISTAAADFEATLNLTEALAKLAESGELPGDIDLELKVEEPQEAPSGVEITPTEAMPAGTQYYIYNAAGAKVAGVEADANGSMPTLNIDAGNYKVLAIPAELVVDGMDNYATTTVSLPQQSGADAQFAGPVAIIRADFEVINSKVTSLKPTPEALVHVLTLSFDVTAPSAVNTLTGDINGIFRSVTLADGKPTADAISGAAESRVNFTAASSTGKWSATLYTLGFLNPANSTDSYTAQAGLSAVTASHGTLLAKADITTELSALAGSEVAVPTGKTATKAVTFEADPEPEPDSGILKIIPSQAMPAGTRYYIYDAAGTKVKDLASEAGNLPATTLDGASYKVLGIPAGLTVSGIENYATATVSLPQQGGANTQFAGPVAIIRAAFEIVNGKITSLTPAPEALVYALTLSFDASGPSAITSLSGNINGLVGSVTLADGKPTADAISGAGSSRLAFTTDSSAGKWNATLYTLGFLNPANSTGSYTAQASLKAVTASHGERSVNANLTTEFSSLAGSETMVPAGKTVEKTVVFPNDPDIKVPGADGSIDDWNPVDPGDEVELN